MSDDRKITVLQKRPLNEEELSAELTPHFNQEFEAADTDTSAEFTEEAAAELAPNVVPLRGRETEAVGVEDEDRDEAVAEHNGFAITGLVLSILSLFFSPYLFATLGIVLGYIGYRRGDYTYGSWAMGVGAVGMVGTFIVSALL